MQVTTAGILDTGLLFLLVLGALIFVHELGHFLLAKWAGVRVERFSLGFGPALWRRRWGETEYWISTVPLGGYVKMYGESPEEEVGEPGRSFTHQPLWKRILIVAAGPFFNFFFAIFLIAFIYTVGIPVEESVQIGQVLPESAAAEAGLLPGDVVVTVNGHPVTRIRELKRHIVDSEGQALVFQVRRGGEVLSVSVTPQRDPLAGEWRIGVELRPAAVRVERANPLAALGQGVVWTWRITYLTIVGLGEVLSGEIPASESLAGPLGIAREVGRQAHHGWRNVIFFTAGISVSLAILNLLPIPVLDGGHLLFFAIELIKGSPLSSRKRELAQQLGLLILVALMVFAFYNDIVNLLFRR
ncbi:MAG: zinc metalloprotease [Candidatus Tectimicrobiota bacterium]|nr:MAG: zinc metalloprotease [Candidatus Tectomicrobia bacterium]